jgi:nucleoside-diphosphate-sugar epimerase
VTKADISSIQLKVGWNPRTTIQQGVEAQIQWFGR